MEYAARTHIGLVRQVNQDSYSIVSDLQDYKIFIVADGMGGHSAGEVASTLATQVVADYLRNALVSLDSSTDVSEQLSGAIHAANEEIYNRADSSNGLSGMGTTVVAAITTSDEIAIGHIGDSRAYLLRDEEIKQLTDDHSLVNELLKNGQLTEDEAIHHPQRNVLLRALGTDLEVEVETVRVEWKENDVLLLCTDGVWNLIDHETLKEAVQSYRNLQELTDHLIKKALDAGGSDNITLIVVRNNREIPEKGDAAL